MPIPEQTLRQDGLGRLLNLAFDDARTAEPPTAVYRAVSRRTAPDPTIGAWRDRWTALSWPHGTYATQMLTWPPTQLLNGLAS